MSDHVPRSLDETDRYMLSEQDPYRLIREPVPESFFQSYNDDFDLKYNNVPPSPILPVNEQSTDQFIDPYNPTSNKQKVVVVNPSRTTINEKDEQLLDNSRKNILSIISLLNEHVISHPFIVVRRQAQVNNRSIAYHLTPFTVIPLMLRLQHRQGITTFFKGLPSVLINYVLLIGSESFFYNLLQFPIDYDFCSIGSLFSARLLKHLALKSLSILVVTPFICSSSVETVQSWIVGESPYVLEHIKEGFVRIFHFRKDRKLPFYRLIGPSIVYHISYYLLYSLIRQSIMQFYYNEDQRKMKKRTPQIKLEKTAIFEDDPFSEKLMVEEPTITNKSLDSQTSVMNELKSSLYAHLLTDMITYPFQNVLYRLFLQGTRTLIDNVDGRTAVTPLITNYDSAGDCYQSIIQIEGSSGLFKGFGALLLQYTVQFTIIHMTNYCIDFILNS